MCIRDRCEGTLLAIIKEATTVMKDPENYGARANLMWCGKMCIRDSLQDNQIVQVGVKIPILDWGKRRGNVRVAKSNRDVVLSKIRQEQINFNQDIFLLDVYKRQTLYW